MTAGQYNITIEQGATYAQLFEWKDASDTLVDLTGFTARMKIKSKVGGTTILSLTNGSGITLNGVLGTFTINISAVDTATFSFERAVYDLEMVTSGTVIRLLEGAVFLHPEVTV